MKKKILSIVLTLTICLMPLGSFAGEFTFTFPSSFEVGEITNSCYYDDSYFEGDSDQFNLSLANMSLSMATAAFGNNKSPKYKRHYLHGKELLEEIGFTDVSWNSCYETKPERFTIGVMAAQKKIGNKTMVAVAFRGSFYEAEWASNFVAGRDGEHFGFEKAKNDALEFINEYVKNIDGDIGFWVTGYSRAAATANLVGAALDNQYDRDNIYVYTYETPRGTTFDTNPKQEKYGNIFNILNPSDVIQYVAPATLNFARYGVDLYLPSNETLDNFSEYEETIIPIYDSLNSTIYTHLPYTINQFTAKGQEFSQSYFASQYVPILSKGLFKSRAHYVNVFEDVIADLMEYVEGNPGSTEELAVEYAKNELIRNAKLIGGLLTTGDDADKEKGLKHIAKILNQAKSYVGDHQEEFKYTSKEVSVVAEALIFAMSDLDDFIALIQNWEDIRCAHFPEVGMAWLRLMDPNYGNAGNLLSNGNYRFIRGTKDVTFEKTNNKYVAFPEKGSYTFKVTAKEPTCVTLYKYNSYTGKNTKVKKIHLKKGTNLIEI